MSDDLERQLEAFGATLESSTGEPIRPASPGLAIAGSRRSRRWWSIAGAAACLLAVVVGLVALTGRDAEAPAVQPAAPTSTSTPIAVAVTDPEAVRTAPIEALATGCDPADVVVSGEFIAAGTSVDEAFAIAYDAIVEHTPPELDPLPADGWQEVVGEPILVRYLDRGRGIEGIVRIRPDGDEWIVTELAHCLPGGVPSAIQTTTVAPPATTPESSAETVPDDPLALERDGWSLVQRTTAPFAPGEIPCEAAQGLADYDGVTEVHDILTPPDGTGLDLDVQVLGVGSTERGNRLADVMTMIGRCAAEAQGVEGEIGALSSIRASWFRAGQDFALVTIVGGGGRSIVLEIEGAPFDDDLIADLAHRSNAFLSGSSSTPTAGSLSVEPERPLGEAPVEPGPEDVLLWVSNQSFDDDPVSVSIEIDGEIVVDDTFEVGSQHNWVGFVIDGLAVGEHKVTARSDTGAEFVGTVTVETGAPRWAVLNYWYSAGGDDGRYFSWDESDEPIFFA